MVSKALLVSLLVAAPHVAGAAAAQTVSNDARACFEAARDGDKSDAALSVCGRAIVQKAVGATGKRNRAAAYGNRGRIYYLRQEHVAAATDFSDALKLLKSKENYYNRGLAYEALGAFELAKRDFTDAVEIDDTWETAKAALARVS